MYCYINACPSPAALLRSHWGAGSWRPGQWEVITALLQAQDVLAILPTGHGKSLCYQLVALLLPRPVLVISPLLALMADQIASLQQRRIPATWLHSSMASGDIRRCLRDMERGRYRLVYLAPEQLHNRLVRECVNRTPPSLVVVDEAHCISTWGHDFRPVYRDLRRLLVTPGDVPWAAFSATAPPAVRADICQRLGLLRPAVVTAPLDRPNLLFNVSRHWTRWGKWRRLLQIVGDQRRRGKMLLYTATRAGCEQLSRDLQRVGVANLHYHGGLAPAVRASRQEAFARADPPVLVSTPAFGMGIDLPDIERLVHWKMPLSLESYYQEAGRAGRDRSRPAEAWLLESPGDSESVQRLLQRRIPSPRSLHRAETLACAAVTKGDSPSWGQIAWLWQRELGWTEQEAAAVLGACQETGFPPGTAGWPLVQLRERLLQTTAVRQERFRNIQGYIRTRGCRRQYLLGYLGESDVRCSGCDRCGSVSSRQ